MGPMSWVMPQVGANHALIAQFLPEKVVYEISAVGIAHIFPVFLVNVIGNGVVGHNGAGLFRGSIQGEDTLGEGLQVLLKIISGIDGVLT